MNTNINLSVQSKSKKIQKTKKSSSNTNTCYNTFDASEKRAIIMDLKKSLSTIRNLQLNNSTSEEFLEILTKVHKNEFNTILRSSLSHYFPAYDDSTEGLRIWRRRVKEWIKMIDKPQCRATLLVPPEKLGDFKRLLISELQNFTFRSLKQLRNTLHQIFYRIGKPLSEKNTCSKHWWYDFLKHNTDVKDVWESLPKRAGAGPENDEEESDIWNTTEFSFNNTSPFTKIDSLENNYTSSGDRSPVFFADDDFVKKEEEIDENKLSFGTFPVVELNENYDLNFFAEKQKSVSRNASVGWEKFFCFGQQRESSTLSNFEDQIKGFGSFLNFNVLEF